MKARIKKLDAGVPLPQYHTSESAAFDLAANQDAEILPGQTVKVSTGLVIEAPPGHFLMIAARSSLGLKKGLKLLNGIGVVDRDYAGPNDEIHLLLHNFTGQPVEIKKGDRIAQAMFVAISRAVLEEAEMLAEESRGGFGSTAGYN